MVEFAVRVLVVAVDLVRGLLEVLFVDVAGGDELHAGVVVSSVDPNLTFLKFMAEGDLPADLADR